MNAKLKNDLKEGRFVKAGGKNIFVMEFGKGFPVIMLHGGGPGASGMSNYSKNIEALSEKFRVIVPDMPGYGQSTKGMKTEDPFGGLAEGILALMDAMDIPKAHLVGNSLGGACALRMALDAPSRVESLILMGPGGVNTTRGLPTKGLKSLLGYYRGDGPSFKKLSEFIRTYLVYDDAMVSNQMIQDRYDASLDPEIITQGGQLKPPTSLGCALKMDFTRDRRLKKCLVPTLVLWGTEDLVNRPSGGQTLQKTMQNCDLYLFCNTGHWVQWERADEFNATATSFFTTHTPVFQ